MESLTRSYSNSYLAHCLNNNSSMVGNIRMIIKYNIKLQTSSLSQRTMTLKKIVRINRQKSH